MARVSSHLAIFAMFLAIVLSPDSARASDDRWRGLVFLSWSPAPDQACPTKDELTEQVEGSLHRHVFAPMTTADRVLRASITSATGARGMTAHFVLTTKDGRSLGEREVVIEERECKKTLEALVLAISVMVDLPPMIGEDRPGPPSPPPKPPPPSAAPSRHPPSHLQGGAGLAAVFDTRPTVYPGVHVSFELALPKFWPLAADVTSWIHTDRTPNRSRYWLSANMIAVAVCPVRHAIHQLRLEGCFGPEVILYVGWGSTFSKDHIGISPTFGGYLKARASYALSPRLHAFASVLAEGTPGRVSLAFNAPELGEQVVYRTAFFKAALVFGATYRFF